MVLQDLPGASPRALDILWGHDPQVHGPPGVASMDAGPSPVSTECRLHLLLHHGQEVGWQAEASTHVVILHSIHCASSQGTIMARL